MAQFVRALSDDQWINLDKIDAIVIMGQGSGFAVIAERHNSTNAILSVHSTREHARSWVKALIGDPDDRPQDPISAR